MQPPIKDVYDFAEGGRELIDLLGGKRAGVTGPLAGRLRYSSDPIVCSDVIWRPASCVFDSALTRASGRLVKVFGWYLSSP